MRQEPNYATYIEYKEYINEFSQDLVTQFINKRIASIKDNKIKFIATGIIIYKNSFIIVFPKGYKIPNDEQTQKEHIQVLFRVLLKYKRESDLKPEEMELLGGENGQLNENLFTSYHLLQDFSQNGLLMKEMKVKTSTLLGRTDWTATINKKQPLFSGGSVIYTDTISRKTTIDTQHQLLVLHKYCISRSLEKYGWLLGLSLENVSLEVTELNCDVNYAINFLSKELNSTFVEREITVIKLIRDFILGIELKRSEEKIQTLLTPYFHNVWESICSSLFNNQYKILKQIIPKLKWEIDSPAPVMPQRPDIILLREKIMFILDAKYYNTDINLPGWHDVVKQLFYAFTIFKNISSQDFSLHDKKLEKRVKRIEKVENLFLFPSSEASDPIKYVGKVNVERNQDFNDIKAFKLNTFMAMKCYIRKAEFNFIKSLEVILKGLS